MEDLTIIWLPKAKIQLYDISLYWLEKTQSESYILKLEAEIAKICEMLEYNPRIGTILDNRKDVRRVIVLRNFSIFYQIIEQKQVIEIISFWDNRNNPEKLNLNRI